MCNEKACSWNVKGSCKKPPMAKCTKKNPTYQKAQNFWGTGGAKTKGFKIFGRD